MNNIEKKRLVFDLTEEEYEDFIKAVTDIGGTKIGLFRRMCNTHRMLPFYSTPRNSSSPATSFRNEYLSIAYGILNTIVGLNQSVKNSLSFINTPDQQWNLFLNHLRQVIDILAAVPPSTSDDNFIRPAPPTWYGIGNIISDWGDTTDIE
jgi:hypothetical protein